jgi:hypothetical protein
MDTPAKLAKKGVVLMKNTLKRIKAIELNLGFVTFVFETTICTNNTSAGEPGKENDSR